MSKEMNRETWKWIIQILASILTALATALGTTACVTSVAF